MIPTRALVWLTAIPLGLAVVTLFDGSVLWPMIAIDVGLFAIALLDAILTARGAVQLSFEAPQVLSIGRPNRVRVHVRSRVRRFLRVEVNAGYAHAQTPRLPLSLELHGLARGETAYFVHPSRRGSYRFPDHFLRYRSPLGLWSRQLRFPAAGQYRVYPDLLSIRTFELLARRDREYALFHAVRRKGGESEFERLRDYTTDDEYRAVDWKATARRQQLTSREYQLEQNQNLLFMLDAGRQMTAEADGLSFFDHALNALLMLAHVAVRNGDRVGLVGFDDSVRAFVAPSGGGSTLRRLVQACYDLHPQLVEADYHGAFERIALRVRRRSLVVLFTQVHDEETSNRILRHVRSISSRHLPLVVMFRDLDVERLLEERSGGPLGLYTRGAAAEILRWRSGLLRDLRRAGAHVLEAVPGELTARLVNRYLEIKARQLL